METGASSPFDPETPPQYQDYSQQGNYPHNPYLLPPDSDPYMFPPGLDPNNIEAVTAYRDAFYKKRAYFMTFFGIMSSLLLIIPFSLFSSSGGMPSTIVIPFMIIALIFIVGLPAYGWISYKKVKATPYVPGTPLFFTGRFGRMVMKY